jgi:hypothetical protein
MPQASDELRAAWRHGEEGGGDAAAEHYLRAAGYLLTPSWEWEAPLGRIPTDRDLSAIDYLIEEWDYGGLTDMRPAVPAKSE